MRASFVSSGSTQGVDFEIFNATDISSAPRAAGWYSWHYIPSEVNDEKLSLYRSFNSRAEVSDLFGLILEGKIRARALPAGIVGGGVDTDLARALLMLYAPPLYFGISKDLLMRLSTHKRQLDQRLGSIDEKDDALTHTSADSDTDAESACFAERLAPFMATGAVPISDLYVRVIRAEKKSDLRSIERIMNIITLPRFGRR